MKVKENMDLERDPESNAIINTNTNDYERYLVQRKVKNQETKKVSSMEDDLVRLKNEMNEIKSLLKVLVDGK